MNDTSRQDGRSIGLVGAIGVGIGAIVGGGVLILVGVAFKATGPSAVVAFALNGLISILTALSFAEMSTAFPESGGAYVFAKKVLNVRAAFAVGWVLWFAYIVAGVLYALGFAEFAIAMTTDLIKLAGHTPPAWLLARRAVTFVALAASAGYALSLIRKGAEGGQWATAGKVVLFAVLIFAGIWSFVRQPLSAIERDLSPFFVHGAFGLMQAMGFTFIALQGFEVIAAVAGEVKEPEHNLPRAMLLSLVTALAIYLPLLLLVATVGTAPGQTIVTMSERNATTVMADAVRNFMGGIGYWLVMLAAVLSTLSALQASLLAASRVALTMARDRTLPRVIAQEHPTRRTPVMAVYTSFVALVAILFMIPDLAAAGAAASLIFLVSFALAHLTGYLARKRSSRPAPFQTPWFPAIPVLGGIACTGMAVFQGFAVPAAGGITAVWLALGVVLYYGLFASRAEAVDAFAQGRDPALLQLRGRRPLILVPIANPKSAPALVAVANSLAPQRVGRVLLLNVLRLPEKKGDGTEDGLNRAGLDALERSQQVLHEALSVSLARGYGPEALLTSATDPWREIARVARLHACQSLVLGLSEIDEVQGGHLEKLLNKVECDVVVLRAPPGFHLEQARRVLVPVGGRGGHDEIRARVLGNLERAAAREVTFCGVVKTAASKDECDERRRMLRLLAEDETHGTPRADLIASDDVVGAIVERARDVDFVVIGLQRHGGKTFFGEVALRIARSTQAATLMISRGK